MEVTGGSVVGDRNAWSIQCDFNVALSSMEHSRLMESAADRNSIKDFPKCSS